MIRTLQNSLLISALFVSSACSLSCQAKDIQDNLWELLEKPQTKPAWKNLMAGHKQLPAWIKDGKGVSSPCAEVTVDGKTYIVGDMCEPHNCAGHIFVAVFSKDYKQAWGLRAVQGYEANAKSTEEWFGNPAPSPEIKKILAERLALRK